MQTIFGITTTLVDRPVERNLYCHGTWLNVDSPGQTPWSRLWHIREEVWWLKGPVPDRGWL